MHTDDVDAGALVKTLIRYTGFVYVLSFSPNKKIMTSKLYSNGIRSWYMKNEGI